MVRENNPGENFEINITKKLCRGTVLTKDLKGFENQLIKYSECAKIITHGNLYDFFGPPGRPFFRQLDFSFEPGVAYEILEDEPKSCSKVA